MLSLLRLSLVRFRAMRMPEIPPSGRRDADFSDTLLIYRIAPFSLRRAPA